VEPEETSVVRQLLGKQVSAATDTQATMITKMFATLDKAKPDTGNTRGLNLATVRHTTVQVSKTAVVAKATSSRA
jgi:hypothetical protein